MRQIWSREGFGDGSPGNPVREGAGWTSIAYQVVGDGPIDLVYATGIWSNLEVMWEHAQWARFLERLTRFSRLILFLAHQVKGGVPDGSNSPGWYPADRRWRRWE